jgi:hypothetical protein
MEQQSQIMAPECGPAEQEQELRAPQCASGGPNHARALLEWDDEGGALEQTGQDHIDDFEMSEPVGCAWPNTLF